MVNYGPYKKDSVVSLSICLCFPQYIQMLPLLDFHLRELKKQYKIISYFVCATLKKYFNMFKSLVFDVETKMSIKPFPSSCPDVGVSPPT